MRSKCVCDARCLCRNRLRTATYEIYLDYTQYNNKPSEYGCGGVFVGGNDFAAMENRASPRTGKTRYTFDRMVGVYEI